MRQLPADPRPLLSGLEQLVARLGIKIRYENLNAEEERSSDGGFCRLREEHIVLIDKRLDDAGRCAVLLRALGQLDLRFIYVPPAIRRLLDTETEVEDAPGSDPC